MRVCYLVMVTASVFLASVAEKSVAMNLDQPQLSKLGSPGAAKEIKPDTARFLRSIKANRESEERSGIEGVEKMIKALAGKNDLQAFHHMQFAYPHMPMDDRIAVVKLYLEKVAKKAEAAAKQ
ncbi:putative secreted RxLR effector protein [Phytophthora cinnamomi]|uniref:putative secreted RxLR effector protein n=1 Tax=Phytophthora cinnamomi TaxID=4785 RepID=UPI0035598839|nr:putative secreted RxLR effector protein [Phytophthora cinnamomi]